MVVDLREFFDEFLKYRLTEKNEGREETIVANFSFNYKKIYG